MELDNTTKENIEKMIGGNDVFLFMKGNPDFPMCGFSSVASAILKKCGVDFGHFNVLDDESIREGIKVSRIGLQYLSYISKKNLLVVVIL